MGKLRGGLPPSDSAMDMCSFRRGRPGHPQCASETRSFCSEPWHPTEPVRNTGHTDIQCADNSFNHQQVSLDTGAMKCESFATPKKLTKSYFLMLKTYFISVNNPSCLCILTNMGCPHNSTLNYMYTELNHVCNRMLRDISL